jgi:phytoene dehydrogenase-like protein
VIAGPFRRENAPVRTGAIVVGGGHNGLICAAYLARAGLETVVVEARGEVGGCASTVSDLGARFNICNCDHMVFRSTPIADELDLAAHGLSYLPLDPVQQQVHWDGAPAWTVFNDVDRTIEFLRATHPGEVDGYRAYLAAARPVAELVLAMARGVPTMDRATREVVARRGRGVTTLLRWQRMSVADVLRQFFRSEALLTPVVSTGPAVWGLSPFTPGTGLGALGYALKHTAPAGRPVGGSGALPAAIRSSFEAAGGKVLTGSTVAAIGCEGDRVRGVRLADGTELEAAIVVVASDPRRAFVEYLTDVPDHARAMVERWRSSPPRDGYESKVDAVIRVLPRYKTVDTDLLARFDAGPLTASTIVSPSMAQISRAHQLMRAGAVAEQPIFFANVPSVLDPTMQPSVDEHVFSLETLFTPYRLVGGWPGSSEPARWLEAYAGLLDNGEEFLAGIDRYRAMTPDVYERDFHMPNGYATSFAGTPISALLGRPAELTRYRTPINGLFLTGAATYPGAGVWGAPGRNCASVVLANA